MVKESEYKGSENKSLVVGLSIAIVGLLCFISLLFVRVFWPSRMLKVVDPRAIPVSFGLEAARAIFLSESGELRLVAERGSVLNIFSWDEDNLLRSGRGRPQVVNFSLLTQRGVKYLIPPFVSGQDENLPGTSSDSSPLPGGLAYAFSDDGASLCWAWRGVVFVGSPTNPRQHRIQLISSNPVTAISFLEDRFLVVIHDDGKVQPYSVRGDIPPGELPGTVVKGRWRISGRGRYRVFSNFSRVDGFIMDGGAIASPVMAEVKVYWGFPSMPTGSFITNTPDGQILLGTSEGLVMSLSSVHKPYDQIRAVALPGLTRSRVIAVYDNNQVILGGDSNNLVVLKDGYSASSLAQTAQGVRLLAVNSNRIALITTGGSLITATLSKGYRFDDPIKFWFAVSFSVLSLFAFVRLIAIDWIKLRL